MSDADPLIIGRFGAPYGIKGWLKIQSFTEPRENLLGYDSWLVNRGSRGQDNWQALAIDAGKAHGKGLVGHVTGVDDRDAAESLKGCEIAIAAQALPVLPEDEYYWHQLEGLSVYSGGKLLGRVDHLMETGANDVVVVKPCEGSIDQRERLIPWLRGSVVLQVDLAQQTMTVEWDAEF